MRDEDKTKEQLINELIKQRQKITELESLETERKRAGEKMNQAAEEWETTFNSITDLVSIQDENYKLVKVNKAYADTFKMKPEDLIGKACYEIIHGTKEPWPNCPHKKTLETKKSVKEEFFEPRLGIHLEVSASPIFNREGKITGSVHLAKDITKKKKMEQQLLQSEKLRSLGELAGGVAHDFNNVLAAILGNAQLIKMNIESPLGIQERRKSIQEVNRGLDIIVKAARDGAETVKRIQEFARRRSEDKYFAQVDINELINNALEFTQTRWKDDAESKGIIIDIQRELSSLPLTAGSASELREVFTNLINNAIDAMPQGGGIKIKTFEEDNHIWIKVEDTGSGIANDRKDRIFDPFFTTKGVKSSGLGLSVSYGIINRHRGTISVDSVEGQGTTFTIKLPVAEGRVEEEKVQPVSGEQKKTSILVIEDEEEVRNLLYFILMRGGHEVETVSGGLQGIELFEKKEFDLVFTDLGMPGMSGWQVAEKIKSINGRVPVVLITGWDIDLKESETSRNWVDLIIHKPFGVDQVLKSVQEGMVLREQFKAV